MRMPNSRQISEEQQDIFEDAPIDGCILVSGPPGTGKTVIAFLRAQILAEKKQDVVVLMFNRVLRRYTENVAQTIDGTVQSKTMHSWIQQWWCKHQIPSEIVVENERVYLKCPYQEKDQVKQLGGKWDNVKKKWYVPAMLYGESPESYSQWADINFDPIMVDKWRHNWSEMQDQYLLLDKSLHQDWGHLIIDEAQDFSPEMYTFLRLSGMQMENGGLTILADENQRLEENYNSSLEDIRRTLKIKPAREFRLTQNFRNTKQIAEVARHFYVGLETGIPNLPKKNGNKPQLICTSNVDQQIKYICNYLQFRAALEVGVIVDSESDRSYFEEHLRNGISGYKVQSYTSKDYMNSENLSFDKQGIVTVLHRKSCKGLEFDTVIIPQLHNFSIEDTDLTTFKMNMYVMCSRARTDLIFLCGGGNSSVVPIFKHFPKKDSGLIEYRE